MPNDNLLDFLASPPQIGSARGGRKPKGAAQIAVLRDLNVADLDLILNPPSQLSTAPAIKSLKHSHHKLARMLAEGNNGTLCSAVTGYSPSRISILAKDPAFAELVTYYKSQVQDIFVDAQERLAMLGIDTVEELHERLNDKPESFSHGQLMSMAEMAFDRSVAPSKKAGLGGPVGGSVPLLPNITINFIDPPKRESDSPAPPTIPGTVLIESGS